MMPIDVCGIRFLKYNINPNILDEKCPQRAQQEILWMLPLQMFHSAYGKSDFRNMIFSHKQLPRVQPEEHTLGVAAYFFVDFYFHHVSSNRKAPDLSDASLFFICVHHS